MLKILIATPLLTLILFIGSVSASDNYLSGQSYYEDASNSLTVSEVEGKEFTPYAGWLSKGYRPSTYWIKLNIHPSSEDLILRIRPAYVENIELFDLSRQDQRRAIGAKHDLSNSDIQAYNLNFNLGSNLQNRQIYLKVKSIRTYILGLEVMPLPEFLAVEHTSALLFVGYLVFMLALALGLLGSWVANREYVLGLFVIQQFLAFFYTILFYGFARVFFDHYLGANVINLTTHAMVVLYPLVALFANKALLDGYSLRYQYKYLFGVLITISILIITLFLLTHEAVALEINAMLILLAGILFWLTALFGVKSDRSPKNGNLSIKVLRIYYTLNLAMFLVLMLPVLGIVPSNELTAHTNLVYNLVSGLIFYFVLQYRAKSILKYEVYKSTEAKKEAENERLRREEQGKLMAMLTHEIKTPLSILRLVVDNKYASADLENYAIRAVSNIDSILDKCIQLDRLDLNTLNLHKTHLNLLELIKLIIDDLRMEERFAIVSEEDMNIISDSDILRVIFSNLIANAIKYSFSGSQIVIATKIVSENNLKNLKFSIQNEFDGAESLDQSRVFEKYYRSPSAGKVSGSGLGLFLVMELAHAMQGEVQCSINKNLITFTVWIPV